MFGKNFIFPMGLGYLAASLELAGNTVKIFEPEIRNLSRKDIFDHLREWKPPLVVFTSLTVPREPNLDGKMQLP
jgi:hypothetical protein